MAAHEQFADDLALYALEALDGAEKAAVEQHVAACAACRRELENLRGDMALMALSASGPHPPQRSRDRLMSAIAAEGPAVAPVRAAASGGWFGRLGWMAAAAVLIAGALLMNDAKEKNAALQREIAGWQTKTAEQDAQLERVRSEFAAFSGPGAQPVTLTLTNGHAQPQGKAIYLQSSGKLLFVASNLPALPDDKAYELWLLPSTGNPVPAGVFHPDNKGSGVVLNPPLSAGVSAKGFAITVEPKEGSAAPTTKPMMVGLVG
jgi:Anti-sigma-K factor rskA/Putative zinc-finger